MPYKPKHCCQCGEKIERIDWKLWSSRRFCEFCETEFGVHDLVPRIVLALGILFGILGLGSYWQRTDKSLNNTPKQLAGTSSNINKNAGNQAVAPQILTNQNVQNLAQTQISNSAAQMKTQVAPLANNLKTKQIEAAPDTAQEKRYFCGAQTKKGTPCSRRIKGGRCWQHTGQPAMLPPEKLIASQ